MQGKVQLKKCFNYCIKDSYELNWLLVFVFLRKTTIISCKVYKKIPQKQDFQFFQTIKQKALLSE